MTGYWEILPFARVFAGDVAETKYKDNAIVTVLAATTAILQLFGYDKGHTSDPDGVTPDLTEKEKALWGKCASVLLQDPEAMKAALEAVSVRTLGTFYSTEAKARFLEAASSEAFTQLRNMIRASSEALVSTVDNLDRDTLP